MSGAYSSRVAHFAVSAIGSDRPGIVAAISGVLLDLDGNIEDSRMTILRGQFAVMLIVSLPEPDRDALGLGLERVRERFGLKAIVVAPVAETTEDTEPRPTHMITVYGADHPGIVHSVATELAERGVNITDLQTKLVGSEEAPLYMMLLEVELGDASAAEVEEALGEVGRSASVDVSLGELDAEAL
jgi:glycine cleavage system transcriptional repressor